jgi:glycosyltransferase involved in cell wall biosynthesis
MRDELAVVIITKNLDWNIVRILDSVYENIRGARQVVLADSASTDQTVALANAYPRDVKICVLSSDQRLTAAAGRYVGQHNSDSEFILFLDGDVELLAGFCENAVSILRDNEDVGVVGGRSINVPKFERPANEELRLFSGNSFEDVLFASGQSAVYRRSALEAADSFSVRVFSDEEPALAIRIRHAGYRVVRLDRTSTLHYTDPADELSTLFKRRSRNLWIGYGQNMREFMGTAMLSDYVRERMFGIAPAIYLFAFTASVVATILTGDFVWVALSLVLSLAAFFLLAAAKRSPSRAFFTIIKRFIILEGTVRGLMDPPTRPEDYSVDYEVLS